MLSHQNNPSAPSSPFPYFTHYDYTISSIFYLLSSKNCDIQSQGKAKKASSIYLPVGMGNYLAMAHTLTAPLSRWLSDIRTMAMSTQSMVVHY